jgi:hypothetical protein
MTESGPPRPIHDAQIMMLQEFFSVYRAEPRFKAGDLVTPRKSTLQRHPGEPHIVLETNDNPAPFFANLSDPNDRMSPAFGPRLDLRVLCLMQDYYCAFWVESWAFEYYGPPPAHYRPTSQ